MLRIAMPLFAALATTSTFAAMDPHSALPPEHHQGKVAWMSGGIGQSEAAAMKREARNYPLELLFVSRHGKRDDYLASMPVTIKDAKGNEVFHGTSDGPYFLARLPAGRYTITSWQRGRTVSRHVDIGAKGRQRVVFEWKAGAARHRA